ncbi:nuclear transport factor 2 family protein [Halococcus agarilyticus]|uniref:nuclear transport factor 2 family protein n=1 Tax=Halococcus agarilyticus TaxID=1232219 RepID=UPI000677830A|nr:nuclear transport factor 2 family protein [Halococcus agarilyticus]
MTAEATIEAYYDALRAGEPLSPFFAESASVVKFGITDRLAGYEEIEAGLREQTETTTDWTVESRQLRVTEHDSTAWFSDDVLMAWRGEDGEHREHETRWSGTLERRDDEWAFVGMHVSTADADTESEATANTAEER